MSAGQLVVILAIGMFLLGVLAGGVLMAVADVSREVILGEHGTAISPAIVTAVVPVHDGESWSVAAHTVQGRFVLMRGLTMDEAISLAGQATDLVFPRQRRITAVPT